MTNSPDKIFRRTKVANFRLDGEIFVQQNILAGEILSDKVSFKGITFINKSKKHKYK